MLVHFAELLRSGAAFVATNANANDTAVAEVNGYVDHASGFIDPEMTDSIEDPVERHPEVALAAFTSAFDAFEKRGKLLSPPLHHADGDVDFGMNHTLRMQLLHHAICDQIVVVGSAHSLRDRFERE